MIKVERSAKPSILEEKAEIWLEELQAAPPESKKTIQKRYAEPEVRAALEEMFHDKCAYCESHVSHVTTAHIEHFRPKGKPEFEHLTFEWENLLLACPDCNSKHKKDQFPEDADGGPLINPCEEEPSEHFSFVFENGFASVYGMTKRGECTEILLKLNRVKLRRYRSSRLEFVHKISKKVVLDSDDLAFLENARLSTSDFSAFARRFYTDLQL